MGKEKGLPIVEALFAAGYTMIDLHHARGSFVNSKVDKKGHIVEEEQEILTFLVEEAKADEAFAMAYELAGFKDGNQGLMYMQNCGKSTLLSLPNTSS